MNLLTDLLSGLMPFDWLEPAFMRRALIGMLFIAPACAAMGVQVVSFRMAFFSDAISHSAFTGVALGLIFGINSHWTMVGFGVLVGCGVLVFSRKAVLSTDTVIGVFFAAVVALGIVIVSARRGLSRYFESVLFGDILAIDSNELWIMFFLFLLVFLFQAIGYNKLLLISLHSPLAHSRGIKPARWEIAYGILLAFLVMISLRAVGLLLVTALLVVPAAAARNLARSGSGLIWWSVLIATISAGVGLFLSYIWGSATGATVILVSVFFFICSYLIRLVMGR
ncbi:ABC transporter [candidate division LCP-89 bacterium B3_LCP]|uniref:ABC transporter n=1 Tax=candidate division LCP-89 bacterium B3_LCP TaxID=2012998 RepID=A0A532V018_UNCL8|nr:MAG: ABC transporter [candidate division LCP-89 bacterium B3_LCP]